MSDQVISRHRVATHGEVLTAKREVDAVLSLVANETRRIESRFLEPACGNGNFLAAILGHKLHAVDRCYGSSQFDYERYSVLAVSSLYGVDILEDNVRQCRQRLSDLFTVQYCRRFKDAVLNDCVAAVRFILDCNIIWGDALTLRTVGDDPAPIVFSEWSLVRAGKFKRRDFTFQGLLDHEGVKELPLFSDLGQDAFIPTPAKEYPLIDYREIPRVRR